MPPYMGSRPNLRLARGFIEKAKAYDQQQRDIDAAVAESGRDPAMVRLESMLPVNKMAEARLANQNDPTGGRLAALGALSGFLIPMRGGIGSVPGPGRGLLASMPEDKVAQQLLKFRGIARRMGLSAQDVEDAQQAGAEGALKAKPEMNPNVAAKRAIQNDLRNQQPHGDRTSADFNRIQKVVQDFEQEKGRSAGAADDFAIYHRFRDTLTGEEKKAWTPTRFLDIRHSAPRAGSLSLDEVLPSSRGADTDWHELISTKGEPSPEMWASFMEKKNSLTKAQQGNFEKILEGSNVHPQIKARILAKLREGQDVPPAISGGSAGDMSIQEYIDRLRTERERVLGGGNPTRFEGSETPLPTDAKPRIFERQSDPSQGKLTLFHATPAGPGIRDTGMLEGRRGMTQAGLGGGDYAPGVSTTTNIDEAMESARLMQRAGFVSRNGLPDDLLNEMILTDLARSGQPATPEMLARVQNRIRTPFVKGQSPYQPPPGQESPGTLGVEQLRNYMGQRNNHLNPFEETPAKAFPRDPYIAMPDDPTEYAQKINRLNKITPEGMRVAKIPQDAIPRNAVIGSGADPGELRVMSDIPGRLIQLLKPAMGSLLGFAGLNALRSQPNQEAQ